LRKKSATVYAPIVHMLHGIREQSSWKVNAAIKLKHRGSEKKRYSFFKEGSQAQISPNPGSHNGRRGVDLRWPSPEWFRQGGKTDSGPWGGVVRRWGSKSPGERLVSGFEKKKGSRVALGSSSPSNDPVRGPMPENSDKGWDWGEWV